MYAQSRRGLVHLAVVRQVALLEDQLDTLAELCQRGYTGRPMLSRGVPEDQIEEILVCNPRNFFAQQRTHQAPGS